MTTTETQTTNSQTPPRTIPLREEDPPPRPKPPTAGILLANITVTLHTKEAVRLHRGRVSPNPNDSIVGLQAFIRGVNRINSYEQRHRIEILAEEIRTRMSELQQQLERHKARQAVELHSYTSAKPYKLKLNNLSNLGLSAANLLALYDQIVLDIYQIRFGGVITMSEHKQMLKQATEYIKKMLTSPFFTRNDVVSVTSEEPTKST